jgi:hypothetical protein
VPDVITGRVLTDLFKLHTAAAKRTAPVAGKQGINLATGMDMQAANFTEFFWR